jgi:hypothetical protein
MSVQSFACPACGSRKTLADAHAGEKIHCTCGMSYPASPVFAVAEGEKEKYSGPGWAILVTIALFVGFGGVAIWRLIHPINRVSSIGPVAVNPAPVEPADLPATQPTGPPPAPSTEGRTTPPPEKPTAEPPPEKPSPPPPPPPPPLAPTPVASLTAVKLWDAFDLDPADAAVKYTDKVVEVTARGRIARDSLDRPYFGVEAVKPTGRKTPRMTAQERLWEKEGYPPSVRCYLAPDAVAVLENLPPDRDVVLCGVCTGRKNVENVYRGYVVELTDCTAVAPK